MHLARIITVEAKQFPSKRDTWVVIVLWIAVAMMVAGAIRLMTCGAPPVHAMIVSLITLATAIFTISVLYGTRYIVTDSLLTIRAGPLRWRVDVASIRAITPSDDPISSPACSLDRLEIAYGDNETILVSPADREGFLAEMMRVQPALVREGAALVRRDLASTTA